MAFTITFRPKGMSAAKYDEVIRQLNAAGAGAPAGRLFHTCYGPPNALNVVDVWSSMEQFEKFGGVLIPILTAQGIDVGQPDVQPQHNAITGKA
ncbi:MAG TPA: hypothetical protein VE967_00465 [Gemmatimonadaceae bacterium]|nr:hypothetical protein [Gemmatimonadaceae bacterium]